MLTDKVRMIINQAITKYINYLSERIDSAKVIDGINTAVATREIPTLLTDFITPHLQAAKEEAEHAIYAEVYKMQKMHFACPQGMDMDEVRRKQERLCTAIKNTTDIITQQKKREEKYQAMYDEFVDVESYSTIFEPDSGLRRRYYNNIRHLTDVDTSQVVALIKSPNFANRDLQRVICSKISYLEEIQHAKHIIANLEKKLVPYMSQLNLNDKIIAVAAMPANDQEKGAQLIPPFDSRYKEQQAKLNPDFDYDSLQGYIFNVFIRNLRPFIEDKPVFKVALGHIEFISEFEDYKMRVLNKLNNKSITLSGEKLVRVESLATAISGYTVTISSRKSELEKIILDWEKQMVNGKSNAEAFESNACVAFFSKTPDNQFIADCLDILEEERVLNPVYGLAH